MLFTIKNVVLSEFTQKKKIASKIFDPAAPYPPTPQCLRLCNTLTNFFETIHTFGNECCKRRIPIWNWVERKLQVKFTKQVCCKILNHIKNPDLSLAEPQNSL